MGGLTKQEIKWLVELEQGEAEELKPQDEKVGVVKRVIKAIKNE